MGIFAVIKRCLLVALLPAMFLVPQAPALCDLVTYDSKTHKRIPPNNVRRLEWSEMERLARQKAIDKANARRSQGHQAASKPPDKGAKAGESALDKTSQGASAKAGQASTSRTASKAQPAQATSSKKTNGVGVSAKGK